MGSVMIDLQEGFMDDTVVIRVGEREVYRKESVSTDLVLGQADSVEVEVPEGSVSIKVSVPSRDLADAVVLKVPPQAHLGVALMHERLKFRISDETFLYF